MRAAVDVGPDHVGAAWARIHSWDGAKWSRTGEWLQVDEQIIEPMVEASAEKYLAEKKLTRRAALDCRG